MLSVALVSMCSSAAGGCSSCQACYTADQKPRERQIYVVRRHDGLCLERQPGSMTQSMSWHCVCKQTAQYSLRANAPLVDAIISPQMVKHRRSIAVQLQLWLPLSGNGFHMSLLCAEQTSWVAHIQLPAWQLGSIVVKWTFDPHQSCDLPAVGGLSHVNQARLWSDAGLHVTDLLLC